MTDPLTPDRVAELRRIASGEDWSPPQQSDLIALLGGIDRLAAERDKADRRAQIAENTVASVRVMADALRKITVFGVANNPDDDAWATADWHARQLRIALNAGFAVPAWGEEFSFRRIDADAPDEGLWTLGTSEAMAREAMAAYTAGRPGWRFALTRRTVGPWLPVGEPQGAPERDAGAPVGAPAAPATPEAPQGPQEPAKDFRAYRCPTPCDPGCEHRCHEGHQPGHKQTHNVAECQARCAAAEAYRRLAPKPAQPRPEGPPAPGSTEPAPMDAGAPQRPQDAPASLPVEILRRPAAGRLAYLTEHRDGAIARGIPAEIIDQFIADAARAVDQGSEPQ